jgi:NACalpha-BTF3-like transcription factor
MQSPKMKKKLKKMGLDDKTIESVGDVADELFKGLKLGN